MYYEAFDLIVSVVDKRFNQESFNSFAQLETLLVKAANSNDYESEFNFRKHRTAKMLILGRYPGS